MEQTAEKQRGYSRHPIPEECIFALGTMLIAMAVMAIAFLLVGMGPGQRHIFLSGDLFYEYSAVNRLFWRNLLQGKDLTYSFSMGMGMPALSTYAYDCFSPFHILFALIEDADLATFLVVLIKTGCSAGSFYIYSRKILRCEQGWASAFGICYSMCGFVVGSVWQIAFLDAVYLLPLLAILLKRAVCSGKYILLTPAYAYCFITMFYTGYMLGLFTAVLYLSFLCMRRELSGKERLSHLMKYIFSAFAGALISAVVTVPTAVFLFSNQPEDATGWYRLGFRIWDVAANFFIGQFQGDKGSVPLVYSGVGGLLLLFAGSIHLLEIIKKHWELLMPVIFLALCMFFKPFYLLINAFDMPDTFEFRFTYMVSFVLLSAAACVLRWEMGKRRLVITVGILALVYMGILCLEKYLGTENANGMSWEAAAINVIFLAVWAILLQGHTLKRGYVIVMAVAGIEMSVNAYLMHHPDDAAYNRERDFYELWNSEGDAVAEGLGQDAEESGAFRVYYENVVFPNDSAYFGYHGLGFFYSGEQPTLRRVLSGLGYATSVRLVCDYGSTPVSRMLFAQKYLVHGTDPRYETPEDFTVQRNSYVLPMAYMVSADLYQYSAGADPFANQDQVLRLMRGDKGRQVYWPIRDGITYTEKGILQTETEERIRLTKELEGEAGTISYHVQESSGRPVCAYFDPAIKGMWHDSAFLFSARSDHGAVGWDPLLSMAHIMPLGQDEEGEYEATVLMNGSTTREQEIKQMYFYAFDTDAFADNYEVLVSGKAGITGFSEGFLRCVAEATKERELLFTSIPYDTGWEAKVDGKAAEIVPVMENAFMAVPLQEGTHEIVLQYHVPGGNIGKLMSVFGLGILAIWGCKIRREGRNDDERE